MASARPTRRINGKPGKTGAGSNVTDYLNALVHPHKSAVLAVRDLILASDSRIQEEVKWNAPSFRIKEHFATFRLHPVPICQLVLHTGSKQRKGGVRMEIADPTGLLKWASPDRCVVSFSSDADAKAKIAALKPVLEAWIEQAGIA